MTHHSARRIAERHRAGERPVTVILRDADTATVPGTTKAVYVGIGAIIYTFTSGALHADLRAFTGRCQPVSRKEYLCMETE